MGYIAYTPMTKKERLKLYGEYIELHKRCIKSYLISKNLKYSSRQKFFYIYDHFINEENIMKYFYLPVKYFVYSLIKFQLSNIKFFSDEIKQHRKERELRRKERQKRRKSKTINLIN